MALEKQQEVLDTIKKMYFPDQSIRLQICHEETIDDALPACQGTAFSFVERPDLLVGNQNAPKAVIIAAIDRDSVCFGANVSIKSNYAQTSRHWKRGNNGESFACDNIAHICAVASLIQELSVYLSARKNELQQKGQTDAFLPIDKDAQNLTECYISEKYSDWIYCYIVRRIQGRMAYMSETNPLVRPFTKAIADYKCNVLAASQEEEFQIKSETLDPYELKWEDVENINLLDYMEMLANGVEIEYRVKDNYCIKVVKFPWIHKALSKELERINQEVVDMLEEELQKIDTSFWYWGYDSFYCIEMAITTTYSYEYAPSLCTPFKLAMLEEMAKEACLEAGESSATPQKESTVTV